MRETFVNDWYFIYRKYADVSNVSKLSEFIAQSTAITESKVNIEVGDVMLPTFKHPSIIIPKWVSDPEAWIEFFGHKVSLPIVLGCTNGMFMDVMQKIDHCYNLMGLQRIKLNVADREKLNKIDEELYQAILKIFAELLCIDFKSKNKYIEFLWFYYELMYGQINVMEIETLSDYLLALSMYYLPENHPQVEYLLPEEVKVLREFRNEKEGVERLFDLLLERFDFDDEDNSQQEEQDDSENDSSDESDSDEQDNSDSKDEQEDSESFPLENKEETLENLNVERMTETLMEINRDTDGKELEAAVNKVIYNFEKRGHMILPKISVEQPPQSTKDISTIDIPTDFGFLKDLLRARTKNTTYGIPRNKGKKIVPVRITRAVTDGKIFSYDQDVEVWKPPEIILLVDGSGSMRVKVTIGTKSYRFYDYVLAVAYKIFNEVKNLTKTSVYVHTSHSHSLSDHWEFDFKDEKELEEFPVLYDLNSGSYHNAFSRALSIDTRVNYDGIAINKVVEIHSKDTSRKKLLIVLSDGMPAGTASDNYFAEDAIKHMRDVIYRARKINFEVIGMSLVPDTDLMLNHIYGNSFVSSGDLQKNLTNVIVKALS